MPTQQTQVITPGLADIPREAYIPFQIDSPLEDSFVRLCLTAPWGFDIVSLALYTNAGTCWVRVLVDDAEVVEFDPTSGGASVDSANQMRAQTGGIAAYTATGTNDVQPGESVKVVVESLETSSVDYLQGQLLIRKRRT